MDHSAHQETLSMILKRPSLKHNKSDMISWLNEYSDVTNDAIPKLSAQQLKKLRRYTRLSGTIPSQKGQRSSNANTEGSHPGHELEVCGSVSSSEEEDKYPEELAFRK
jgi:hypothetical protein